MARITSCIAAGNVYVNRNIIGAVVGVQPFGGQGLSGTGPKAGGPLYLRRLLAHRGVPEIAGDRPTDADSFSSWLSAKDHPDAAIAFETMLTSSPAGYAAELPGPVGERNVYRCVPRGEILLLPLSDDGLFAQLAAVVATGNRAAIVLGVLPASLLAGLPPSIAARIRIVTEWTTEVAVDGVLVEGDAARQIEVRLAFANRDAKIVPVQGMADLNLDLLVHEVSVSVNTAAAGGNASLMALREN